MPIVRVNMFEGRSLEKKRRLVQGITQLVAEVCEVSPEGVHVLIEEMSRDDWGRGGTLHRDRGSKELDALVNSGTSFRSVSWVTVKPEFVDEYLAYRRDHVNPAMASMSGFRNTLTLADSKDQNSFLIINNWDDEPAWRAYQQSDIHDQLRDKIRGELVETMEIGRYSTMDLPFSSELDQSEAKHHYFTVSTHCVKTDQVKTYLSLRKTSVHPSMAEFDGFISSNAMGSLDEPYAFLIVNSWASKDAASKYGTSEVHFTLRDQVRALLSEHSGTREYTLVEL